MAYLYLLVVVFFSLSGFFSRISSSFFSSFCFTACFSFFNKLLSVCSWCSTTFYHSFIYLFIYLSPQIYVINMMRAILLATFMPGVRQIHREDNSNVALPVNCVHLIDWWNTRNNVSQRERERERERRCSGFWFSLRKERLYIGDLTHFRFSRLHQNQLNNGREDDPFTFANFPMEGATYDLMANIFRDLEDRRWPFDMMRNMWSRT